MHDIWTFCFLDMFIPDGFSVSATRVHSRTLELLVT